VATTILSAKERIEALPEADRPGKILFVVITDGLENASHEYNRAQVRAMVECQRGLGWQFVYLGAAEEAFAEAGAMGIPISAALHYTPDSGGTLAMLQSLSTSTRLYRSGETTGYVTQDEDRDKALHEE
jgi:hypothetical protein